MNVRCSHCNTVFRVDPDKVPVRGVRARCSVCRGVFAVVGEESSAPSAEPVPVAAASAGSGATGTLSPSVPSSSASPIAPPAVPMSSPAPPVEATAAHALGGAKPRFGVQDPDTKARRLARALVSDMVTYHPERQGRGLRDGTLRQEFREEIRKSWEEYVEQVGKDMAHGTPFFRDALNEILARGQKIF